MEYKHLKITVESDGKKLHPIEASIVPTALPKPGAVRGPLVYVVTEDGEVKWADTMPDPFEIRSMPARGKHEHHYSRAQKAVFVLRVPLPEGALAPDFSVDVILTTGDMPRTVAELPSVFERQAVGRRHTLGRIDLSKLERLPEWGRLKSENGLNIRGERSEK